MTDDELLDDIGLPPVVSDNAERDAVTIPIALGVLALTVMLLIGVDWLCRLALNLAASL